MKLFAWVWLALMLARSAATETSANPMGKVISLLDVLGKQLETEGKEDAKTYREYTAFYQKETEKGEKIIKDNANKISQLKSDLQEAEAFREGKSKDLVDLANKMAKNSAELDAGRKGRATDRAVFEKNEAVFIESLDQLARAVTVMAKKQPAAAASASSASLLSVAQRLKNTLMSSSEFALSTAQRETLDTFMRSAQMVDQEGPSIKKNHKMEAAPAFLQLSSGANGPYGAYSGKSGGLVSTLQDLKGKVGTERDAALVVENKAKAAFKQFEEGLVTMLENGKKSLADIKSAIAQSQEKSSQQQASLMESQEIYKTEVAHMEQVEAEFRSKTQAYKIRLGKRSDEAIAVHEAQRILSSEVAKSYIKQQTVGTLVQSAASFIQMSHKSMVHVRHARHGADPFAKVKTMIQGMLKKLKDKQAADGKKNAWCDTEMGKTAKAQKRKLQDVQKNTDRLDSLDADLTQIKADIETLGGDLKSISEASAGALVIRQKEKTQATAAIKQYKGAVTLLKKACKVLKGYYKNKDGGGSEVDKKEFKDRHGLGTGIIGILEIAIDDFKKLYSETKESEEAAEKDFKETTSEGQIRTAVFQKDLDWKSRTKVKLEFDQATMTNDLKSYKTELVAIDNYMEKLKASCIVKGPSYEEKKAQRESELKSLKEALTFLANQAR